MTETIGRDAETVGQTAPAESTGQAADRTGFHPLTVRTVEHLTEDSAAVTFDVPAEVAELFDFAAGQSLTLRRMIDGVEHRRTYSICAPAGAPRASACARSPTASSPAGSSATSAPVRRSRSSRPAAASELTRASAASTCASPPVPASPRCSRSRRRCSPTPTRPSPSSTATARRTP